MSIEQAFEQAIAAISQGMPTEWPNVSLVPLPAAGVPYQTVSFLYADPANDEFSANYRDEGYAQILLKYPAGVGSGDVNARVKAIRDAFPRGRALTAGGVTVTIERTPAREGGFPLGDRYVVPVRIRYFAQTAIA